MAEYTPNVNLYKPNRNDDLEVDVTLSENFTKIDGEFKNVNTLLAERPTQTEVRMKAVKLEQTDLSETLLQQIAGTTPINAIPADGSITTEKVDFIEKSANLFNSNDPNNLVGYLNGGSLVNNSGYYTSHKIKVVQGETFTIRFAEVNMGAFYDVNDVYISKIGTTSGTSAPFTFTVPANASYMRVSGYASAKSTDMVVKGSTYPSSFVPFSLTISDKITVKDNSLTTAKFKDGSVAIEKTNFVNPSLNLFDKTDASIVKDKYITNTGSIANGTGLFYSHSIPVKSGEVYIIPRISAISDGYCGGFYDVNGNFLSTVTGVSTGDNLYRIITVPTNASIVNMKVNYDYTKIDNFMIVKGNVYPSQYTPFAVKLIEKFGLNNRQKSEIGTVSVLNGKITSFNGDSISYGAGFTGGYGGIIATRNSMIYENVSVSGGTITAGTLDSGGNPRNWITRTIANMRSDAEYIILEGGVNDCSLDVPFGTITPDFSTALDDLTFCGAFESMLKQSILRFQGKKIGFVIVHRIWVDSHRWNTKYYPAIKQMCEKWGVPYCDLHSKVPSLNLIPELKTAYTNSQDGWHPNEAGYKQFYVDKIEAWMKAL